MYKLCKTEQSAARQREVEWGLLELMKVQRYEDISVSDLCDHVGIPRKSFYRYFSSKDGAFHALLDHTMMEYELFSLQEWEREERTLELDLQCFFEFWYHNRDLLTVIRRSNQSGVLIERAIAYSVSESTLPRRFLPDDDPFMQAQITSFSVCGMMAMVLQWHEDGFPCDSAAMAKIAVRLVTRPLFPDVETFY